MNTKPKMPLNRIINEARQVGICDKCGSSLVRKYLLWIFGSKKCINTECNEY